MKHSIGPAPSLERSTSIQSIRAFPAGSEIMGSPPRANRTGNAFGAGLRCPSVGALLIWGRNEDLERQ